MNDRDSETSTYAPEAKSTPVDPLEVRSNPRVGMDTPVQIYCGDFGGGLMGRSRDLSIGGACLATQSPFGFKSIQHVTLSLPTQSLTLNAIGCWQREDPHDDMILTGVQFEDPQPEQLDVVWDQVLDAGKKLARFLYEKTALRELGLEESMGLAQVTRFRSIRAGDTIFRQGTRGEGSDSIFLVLEGSVTLQLRVRDAIETPLAQVSTGEIFGGLPLLADLPHAESAVANTDLRLLEIDNSAYRYLRSMKPWLGHRLGVALLRVHAMRMSRVLELASERL